VLESNFYAWRVTGDTKYLDRAHSAVDSFNKYLAARTGFAGIYDVNSRTSTKIDQTESFWFAEVLKYLWVVFTIADCRSGSRNFHTRRYLTFDDPNHISLDDCEFPLIQSLLAETHF
jgi:mannosyl-oligosaccharide alpha-1,2-mannosidase